MILNIFQILKVDCVSYYSPFERDATRKGGGERGEGDRFEEW